MMNEIEITCDDEHRYRVRVDNKLQEVPSVTTIMNDVGYYPWCFKFKDDEKMEMLNAAAKRGTAVHQLTEDLAAHRFVTAFLGILSTEMKPGRPNDVLFHRITLN